MSQHLNSIQAYPSSSLRHFLPAYLLLSRIKMAQPLTCESNFGFSISANHSEPAPALCTKPFAVDVATPALGLTYQRPSTAALPIAITNRAARGCDEDDAESVLIHVCVQIADAADDTYTPMPRAEYTLQIGVFSDPSKASVASLGAEVSHVDAWHALAPGARALVKVSPLERSINTGRFLRVRIDVRSFATPAAGAFFTEPRVILSRAGSETAILKILGDAHACEARAIGQTWVGALARPACMPEESLKGLAKALRLAATRAAARKPGKRGGGRRAASESDGEDDAPADSASSPLAEGDGDEGSLTDGSCERGVAAPATRCFAGRKRSAAEAARNFAPTAVRLRRAAAVAVVTALVAADAAPSPRETPSPPPLSASSPRSGRGTLLPIGDDDMPAAVPHALTTVKNAAIAASSTRLDYEASLSMSCMLEADDEAAAAAGSVAAQRGPAPLLHRSHVVPAAAPPAVHAGFPPAALALFRSLSQNLEVMCPAFSAGRAASSVAPLLRVSHAGQLPAGGSPLLGGARPWTHGTMLHGTPTQSATACESGYAPASTLRSGCTSPIFCL